MMRYVAVIFTLCCGHVALAIAASAAQQPQLPAGTGLILGRVVEAGTTTPVPGATVSLTGSMPKPVTTLQAPPGGPRREMTSDSEGRFLFRDLPAGQYQLSASTPGYATGSFGQTRVIQIVRSLDVPRFLDLADGERRGDVLVPLFKYGGIGGAVLDEAGEPMVGVPVSVMARVADWSGVVTQQTAIVTTDDRGIYHVDVTPGEYLVAVLAQPTTMPASALDAMQQRVQGVDPEGVRRFGELLSLAGASLVRVPGTRVGADIVSLGTRSGVPLPWVTPAGQLFMYPTTYHPSSAAAVTASIVSVGVGEEKGGINVQMRPVLTRRVSGRLVGPAGPAALTGVRLIVPDPTTARTSPASWIESLQATTNERGEFTFLGVVPGEYTLRVLVQPQPPLNPTLWAAEPVAVGDADIANLTIALHPGATFSGRIVFEGAGAPPPPAAMRAMSILPRGVPGTNAALLAVATPSRTADATRPDDQGRFTTAPFVPGPYALNASGVPAGWTVKSIITRGHDAMDIPVELEPAGLNDLVVTLTNRLTRLGGVVRDDDGKAGVAAVVGVFPADKNLWRRPGMGSRRVQVAVPGRDGVFGLAGLPAGEYYVVAVSGAPVDFSNPQSLSSLIPSATRFSLADGEARSIELRPVVVR